MIKIIFLAVFVASIKCCYSQFYDNRSIFIYLQENDASLVGKPFDFFRYLVTQDNFIKELYNSISSKFPSKLNSAIANMSYDNFYRSVMTNDGYDELIYQDDTSWSLNGKTLVQNRDTVRVWIKVSYYKEEQLKEAKRLYEIALKYNDPKDRRWLLFSYSLDLMEFDLKNMRSRHLKTVYYTNWGDNLGQFEWDGAWNYATPGTIGYAQIEEVKNWIEENKKWQELLKKHGIN